MAEYRDLVVRQYLDPSEPQHYGGTASPDVIVAGTEPVKDPAVYATPASYASDPSVAPAAGQANYVYPRTRMPEGVSAGGLGRLYVGAAPPTVMLWPDSLVLLDTSGGDPYVEVDVPAGEVGVAGVPFVAAGDPAGTLGAYVTTVAHPVKPKRLGSIGELQSWLFKTPGFAQRCAGWIEAGASVQQACSYEHRGSAAVTMRFSIEWDDCPAGWRVGLDGDHGIALPMTAAAGSMGIDTQVELSGDFVTPLTWRLEGGAVAPATAFRLLVCVVDADLGYVPLGGRTLRARPTADQIPRSEP